MFAATTEEVSALPPLKFKKGERIFWKNDAADAIFRVQEGIVGYRVSSSNGKEALLALLGPGNLFGDRHLAGIRTRACSAAIWSMRAICAGTCSIRARTGSAICCSSFAAWESARGTASKSR